MRWGWAFCVFSKCFRYIPSVEHSLIKNFVYFIYLFLVALGLHFCVGAFSSCSKWKVLFIAVHRLLTAVAFSVAENRLSNCGSRTLAQAQELQLMGAVALQHMESSWTKDWTPLHWQAKSYLLHQLEVKRNLQKLPIRELVLFIQ